MEMIHTQKQEQQLALTQEMLTSLNVLELTGTELMEFVLAESQSNPALDSDEALAQTERLCDSMEFIRVCASDRTTGPAEQDEDPQFEETIPLEETLSDHLMWQIRTMQLEGTLCAAARWIISNLDEDGYFRESSLPSSMDEATFREAMAIVQSLDPAGVGARDLAQSMILQLRRQGRSSELIEAIIGSDLESLAKFRFEDINRKYGITGSEQYLDLIRGLNPRPSAGFSTGSPVHYVIPEVTYQVTGSDADRIIETQLNHELVPKITVSQKYLDLIKQADPEETPALQLYVRRLHGIIESIEKRNTTLLRVAQAIAEKQSRLILGDSATPAPLTMKEIAQELDLNSSTISRCVRGKYVRVRDRVIPMKDFFQGGLSGQDAEVSQSQVMEILKGLIASEDKRRPLSDEQLMQLLNAQGIGIKRRTVAKYRMALGFETASTRKRQAQFNG